MTPKLFSELGLSPEILKAIDKLGFEQASPIQAEAIPVLLAGKDIVGQSQTGSGKTAAFGIPAIEKTDPQLKAVQVLILCPTRELAVQVAEEIHKLALFKRGIISLPIYGGQSYERQFYGLKQGAQIVIGTPGRVMDHLDRGTLRLNQLKMIVLDEADVMLDMGFQEDIEKILVSVPAERQTVFFSATMPKRIRDLIEKFSREPQSVKIEQKTVTVTTVEQVYYEVDRRFKVELLTRLIDIHDLKLGIIFCNTKRMVDELVEHLEAQGYQADRLHGDMSQGQRDRVMNRFRKSGLEFLVATDVAARGIDVDDVEVVFNYDLPYDAEDYVHRIGRTGRAGRSGRAISFVSGREIFQIRNIERYTNMRVQRGRVPTLEEVDEARSNLVLNKVRATLQSGQFKRQDHFVERLLEEGFNSADIASAVLHLLQDDDETPTRVEPKSSGFQPPNPAYARRELGSDRPPERPRRDRQFDRPPRRESSDLPERPAKPFREPKSRDRITNADRPAIREQRPNRDEPASSIRPPTVAPRAPRGAEAPPPKPRVAKSEARQKTASPAAPPWTARVEKAEPSIGEQKPSPPAAGSAKRSDAQTRLHMNLGATAGLAPADYVNAIMGETGLPAKVIGKVDLRDRHAFVEVAAEHANAVISKLNRAGIAGRRVKVKVA